MHAPKLGWGILGTAQIARKNWRAIGHSGNATVLAVASRELERSRRFIQECQAEAPMDALPQALGSYEELLSSRAIAAVYIPLPTGLRKEWVLRAAAAGKHIVCEKPCAVSVSDLREMLAACRRHQVQFMDGVMFMHSRRLERMRELLAGADGIGGIRRLTSAFSFCAPPEFFAGNIRAQSRLEPHGCLGDLGWYCLRLALWAMEWRMPTQVTGRVLSQFATSEGAPPVPTEFTGELLFEAGVSAGFYCSFLAENQEWAILSGTRGYLRVDDFVLPFSGRELTFEVSHPEFTMKGGDFEMVSRVRRFAISESSHGDRTAQESNLFRAFSEQVRSGRINASWSELALKTQTVMCACFDSAAEEGRPVRLEPQ